MRKKALTVYFWIIIIGAVYAALIFFTGIEPKCVTRELFGFECGTCGVTHMLISMAHLDFAAAFSYNPVLFVLFWLWNIVGVLCIIDKTRLVRNKRFIYTLMWISVAAILIFGVLRNFFVTPPKTSFFQNILTNYHALCIIIL